MKKYLLLLVPLLFLMAQCHKDVEMPRSFVQGTVISFYDSSKVVPAAIVYLHRGQDGNKIDSTKSDAQGKFRIDFAFEKNIMYGVTAKHDKYFESSKKYFYPNGPSLAFDNIKVAAYPKSYIRVSVKDETRNERYVGVRLNQTTFSPYRLIYAYPLDTTVIIEAYFENSNMDWGFVYENNIWGSRKIIQLPVIAPSDTFNLSIKF